MGIGFTKTPVWHGGFLQLFKMKDMSYQNKLAAQDYLNARYKAIYAAHQLPEHMQTQQNKRDWEVFGKAILKELEENK